MKVYLGNGNAANSLAPGERELEPGGLKGNCRRFGVETDAHIHIVDRQDLIMGRNIELGMWSGCIDEMNEHDSIFGHEADVHQVRSAQLDDRVGK